MSPCRNFFQVPRVLPPHASERRRAARPHARASRGCRRHRRSEGLVVHQGAIDVLGRVAVPQTVHQAKFSMGTVLALVAEFGYAGLDEFDRHFLAPRVAAFRDRVAMQLDGEVDTAYPRQWIGKVPVRLRAGRVLEARVDEPKGDPGNTLSRPELEDKARRLAAYGEAATPEEMDCLIQSVWRLEREPRMGRVFSR